MFSFFSSSTLFSLLPSSRSLSLSLSLSLTLTRMYYSSSLAECLGHGPDIAAHTHTLSEYLYRELRGLSLSLFLSLYIYISYSIFFALTLILFRYLKRLQRDVLLLSGSSSPAILEEKVVGVLRALHDRVEKLHTSGLFPYNARPLLRRLLAVCTSTSNSTSTGTEESHC